MSTDTDRHLNTGAMALDSLPRDEMVEFIDHLSSCPSCSAEFTGFLETAALLGSAVAQVPPAHLKRTVMATIKQIPQLPPITRPQSEAAPLGRHRRSESVTATNVVPIRRAWYRRPQAFLAAAIAALAIAGGTTLIVANSHQNQPSASCTQTASDRRTIAPRVGSGGDVIYSRSCGEASVTPAGLPPLPAQQVYQLWALKDTGTARSIGVLKVNSAGSVDSAQAKLQSGENRVAISVETAPGPARSPSKDIVWAATL